jgi:hypothetical protein
MVLWGLCLAAAYVTTPSLIPAAHEHGTWLRIVKHQLIDGIKTQKYANASFLDL